MAANAPGKKKGKAVGQSTMFSTNRGRLVKRLLWLGAAASLVMMIVTSPSDGGSASDDTTSGTTAAEQVERPDPRVAAAVGNPMDPYYGVNDVANSEEGEGGEEPVDPDDYEDVVAMSQQAAVAFTTYNYTQTPAEWVNTIPGLAQGLNTMLVESADETWPAMEEQQVTTSSALAGAPQIIYYRESDGQAQVLINVNQQVSSSNGTTTKTKAVAVTLVRGEDPTLEGEDEEEEETSSTPDEETWFITGILSN